VQCPPTGSGPVAMATPGFSPPSALR